MLNNYYVFLFYTDCYVSLVAVFTFDKYKDEILKCVEMNAFTMKCIQDQILWYQPVPGTSIDQQKEEVLKTIRNNIVKMGVQFFLKVIKVLENHSLGVAIKLNGTVMAYTYLCTYIV